MKAVMIERYGGPEVLTLAELPDPQPGPDEVLIEVAATTVNPVDWLVRDGAATSWIKAKPPIVLGCELAGRVVARGANAKRFQVGDEVFAQMPHDWGANAQRVALAEHLVVKKPSRLSMHEAAAIPVAAMTALNGLRNKANVQPGERVLINGASGGVGLAAVQIGKVLGAHVTAVCGSASLDKVRELGADAAIDYRVSDFRKGTERYDVIFDCVGSARYQTCQRVLHGRRVHVVTMPGLREIVRQLLNPIMRSKVYWLVTTGNGEELTYLAQLVESGRLKPVIDRVFPLADVAAAQEYSKSGRAKGKIILAVQ